MYVIKPWLLYTYRYTVSLKSPQTLFLDYMVLIPREYYEASILQQPVLRVCRVPDDGQPCQHYVYVDITSYPTALGEDGVIRRGNNREETQLFPDRNICRELGVTDMAYLNARQVRARCRWCRTLLGGQVKLTHYAHNHTTTSVDGSVNPCVVFTQSFCCYCQIR